MSDHSEAQALVDRLLQEHDPKTSEPADFWGAQYDLGLAWVDFPVGLGGRGWAREMQDVVDDRLHAAGAPVNRFTNFPGIGMAAPTLHAYAPVEDQERLLRPIFTCEEIWCQLFSEPGAGSDVASLATRAVRDGDEWVITGQKVWATLAHVARWGLLIARDDPQKPKHRGLTYFYVDMRAPGVEVRPLRQITGSADFNEVFLHEVRVPDRQRLGEVGEGWRVAMTTLNSERSALGDLAHDAPGTGPIRRAVELYRERGGHDPILRDRLARLWIQSEVVRLTSMRAQARRERGEAGPEGAVLKLVVSQFQQRLYELCVDLLGAEAMLVSDYAATQPTKILESNSGEGDLDIVKTFLRTRSATIAGGTSEIARNTIGERVLGLPPEPRADKDLPWAEVPRS